MVQLEEVKDPELDAPQQGPPSDDFEDDADFTDTDSSFSEPSSPTFAPSESPLDRLIALQDMIPPTARRRVTTSLASLTSLTKSLSIWSGKGLYVLSTSALLVAIPYAMAYVEEASIIEQEREMKAREGGMEAISPGATLGGGMGGKPAL